MEETIKRKEVIAYKGMKYDMTCRDFKYELGKSYKTDNAELCKCGFHACLNPIDVLEYYPKNNSRYFRVLLSGEITKCGKYYTEVAATEITILEEINIDEIIKTTEWWKHENVLDLLYFSDGFAIVQRGDGLWNFIDTKGNILLDEWFEDVFNFHEGFAVVQRVVDEKYNFIDKDGKYLTDEWFKWSDDFRAGFAIVQRSDKLYNFIDKKGRILSNKWFSDAHYFKDGFARVQRRDGLWNFITKDGKIISSEWFNYLDDLFRDGFAKVKRTNGELAKIDKNGKIVSE